MARIVSRYLTPRGFVVAGDRLSYTYRDTISHYGRKCKLIVVGLNERRFVSNEIKHEAIHSVLAL